MVWFADLLVIMVVVAAMACVPRAADAAPPDVVTYPAPAGQALSSDYRVTVKGKPVDVYAAPTWQPSYAPPFGGPYSFAYFDLSGAAQVQVTTDKPLDKLVIRPESRGIKFTVEGKTITFQVDKPCQLSIEPNAKFGPLLLFVNPIEVNPPKQGDPGVKYFGPGIHEAGAIKLGSNETLYIAGGAVVRGGVEVRGENVRILGRGIIDGLSYARFKGPIDTPISMKGCRGVRMEGIILKDSWSWTLVSWNSENVDIRNVKIASARCENNDGIDIVNCSNVTIRDCFVRSDDDCIAVKGMDDAGNRPAQNITATNCVLWTDRANIWRIACESRAEVMRNLVFRDIDVIHYCTGYIQMGAGHTLPLAITLQPAEDMPMENVVFEDIRIHNEGQSALLEVWPFPTQWARRKTPGSVRNVTFKNITVTGEAGEKPCRLLIGGADAQHMVENVIFDNVCCFGELITPQSPQLTIVPTYVRNVIFKQPQPRTGNQ